MAKPISLRSYTLIAFIAVITTTAVFAHQDVQNSSAVNSVAHEIAREERVVTANVLDIDHTNRLITLLLNNGDEITVKAGTHVRNLEKLKPGDKVTAHYEAVVAFELLPEGSVEAGTEYEHGPAHSASGTEPEMNHAQSVSIVSKLTAIDLKRHSVTLTDADGHQHILYVKDPERRARMSTLRPGVMVRITRVEAVAVTIMPQQ